MARLYTNENFPLQGAQELRRLGHDVLTVQEAGKALQAISDEEVVAFAKAQERAVVSLNRKHFVRLHQTVPDHSGIVVCTFDLDFAAQAIRIHKAILEQEPLTGKLVRINRPGQ